MTNILVTGGAGYVGSHTCKQLANEGYFPVTFDNLSLGSRRAVRYGPLIQGDLANTELLYRSLRSFEIEAVAHFAANAYVGESMQNPNKYFRNNVAGTISLLDAMRRADVERIVFSSTCAVYGQPQSVPLGEDHQQKPVNPYGESKLFVERMLQWHSFSFGLKSVALRYFNAAGADLDGELGEDHVPETHLIPLAIQTALGQRAYLETFGHDYPNADGTAIRDYVHVCDLAEAHVAALRYLQQGGLSNAFNLGTGRGVSVWEVIRCVEEVSRRGVVVRKMPRRLGDPDELVADARKAESILGWQARHSDIKTIVESAWRWHQSRANGFQPAFERGGLKERAATP